MAGASLRPCAVNWIICKHVELPGATRAAKNISLPSIVATCQQLCSPCATHSIKLMGRPARILPVSPALSGSRRLFSDAGRSRHSAAHKKNQWPRSQWSGMGAYTHVKATHKHSVPSGCVTIAPHRCHSRSAISVINFLFVGRAAADSFDYRLARFIRLALRVTNKRRVCECVSLMLNQ